MTDSLPQHVHLREVGLRDVAGQREIEVGSFVPARLLPQLADTAELVAFARTLPGLVASPVRQRERSKGKCRRPRDTRVVQ